MGSKKLLGIVFIVAMMAFVLPAYGDNNECKNPKINGKSILSPWICEKDGILVYRINVFNLDPKTVNQKKLRSILRANVKDSWENFAKTNGKALDIKLYPASRANDPSLFNGDRIPFYISTTDAGLGTHSVEATEPANSGYIFNYTFGNGNSESLIEIPPPSNYPEWAPWGFSASSLIKELLDGGIVANDPYAISNFYQFLSAGINHELKELMENDSLQNWVVFDSNAPTVASWHYAEFNAKGVCTNGKKGPDGFIHLPLLSEVFPAGGIFTLGQENCDPVGRGYTSKLNSYKVDGWRMTNYVLKNFWKGYFTSGNVKLDKNDLIELPLQPFAGLLESTFLLFLDLDTGITYYGEVQNWGPVTAAQRNDPPKNNFPPDYNIFSLPMGTIPVGKVSLKDLQAKKHKQLMNKIKTSSRNKKTTKSN